MPTSLATPARQTARHPIQVIPGPPLPPAQLVPSPIPAHAPIPVPAPASTPAVYQPAIVLPPRTHRDGVFGMAVGVGILVALVAFTLALSSGMTEQAGGRGFIGGALVSAAR